MLFSITTQNWIGAAHAADIVGRKLFFCSCAPYQSCYSE